MEHSPQALCEEMIASMEGGFDGMPLDYTLDYVIFLVIIVASVHVLTNTNYIKYVLFGGHQ
jgi:hypothetical protein